ncbi:MAG: hypothetical protein H8E79_00430 [Desulfobulbaceae bacterium]|uniref:Nucleoside recognition protein n=1 Tax=Candidatus Desulfatifera sulfidica TaxID=2841691 RepID=A0A8J6T983_9BACT|nr:hypothetical protein [Candidatus Desulfatifera sulfidica]
MTEIFTTLFQDLIWPLTRLMILISFSLMAANFIESLNWTRRIALLAKPIIRLSNLSSTTGASFSLAIFSGIAANTLLAEAYDDKRISKQELVLANLFNSLPTYFLHLPTVLFITASLIKGAAVIYVAITFGAAILRTLTILIASRFLLKTPAERDLSKMSQQQTQKRSLKEVFALSLRRFKTRLPRIVKFTVPIYIIVYLMNQSHFFSDLEQTVAGYLSFLPWLSPQSMGIITLHIAAEFTAGLAAAGALLQNGTLGQQEIILALIVGNILSSPVRALRHQFPFYAGIFQPRLAAELILCNQLFRIISLIFTGTLYFLLSSSG